MIRRQIDHFCFSQNAETIRPTVLTQFRRKTAAHFYWNCSIASVLDRFPTRRGHVHIGICPMQAQLRRPTLGRLLNAPAAILADV
jgi:hypothetical protein